MQVVDQMDQEREQQGVEVPGYLKALSSRQQGEGGQGDDGDAAEDEQQVTWSNNGHNCAGFGLPLMWKIGPWFSLDAVHVHQQARDVPALIALVSVPA
jgi:hypothetical protein